MTTFNMVESPQGPDPKRLLLAVVATSAVLMLYSYFFAEKPAPPEAKLAPKEEVKPEPVAKPVEYVGMAHEQATANILLMTKSFAITADNNVDINARASYDIDINNFGGIIDRFILTDFNEHRVLFDEAKLGSSLLRLTLNGSGAILKDNAPYEIISSDSRSIVLRHVTKEGLAIVRHYHFGDHDLIKEEIVFKNLASSPIKLEPTLTAKKLDENKEEPGFLNPGVQGQSITINAKDKHQRFSYADLLDKPK